MIVILNNLFIRERQYPPAIKCCIVVSLASTELWNPYWNLKSVPLEVIRPFFRENARNTKKNIYKTLLPPWMFLQVVTFRSPVYIQRPEPGVIDGVQVLLLLKYYLFRWPIRIFFQCDSFLFVKRAIFTATWKTLLQKPFEPAFWNTTNRYRINAFKFTTCCALMHVSAFNRLLFSVS